MNAILLAAVLAAPPGPLSADPVADQGELKAGPTVSFAVPLTHRGTGRIAVTGVETGCGCVAARVSKDDLNPGDAATLTFAVNTLTQPAGPNAWTATVKYRHLAAGAANVTEESVSVRVTATLIREVTATPPSVSLSTAGAANTTVILADTRAKPLTVTGAVSTAAFVTAAVRPAAGGKQVIDIAVTVAAPVGHSDEVVVLTTDDPAYRELRVPVRVAKRAAGGVTASPDAVELKFAAGQEEAAAVVVVRSPNGERVRIEKAESDHPAVKLTWSKTAGATATVKAVVPAGAVGPAEVRVRLAEPAGALVLVPVTWPR